MRKICVISEVPSVSHTGLPRAPIFGSVRESPGPIIRVDRVGDTAHFFASSVASYPSSAPFLLHLTAHTSSPSSSLTLIGFITQGMQTMRMIYTHTRPLYTVQVYKRVYYPAQIRNLIAHIVGMPIINTRRILTSQHRRHDAIHGHAPQARQCRDRSLQSAALSIIGATLGGRLSGRPRPWSTSRVGTRSALPGRLYQVGSTRSALPWRSALRRRAPGKLRFRGQ